MAYWQNLASGLFWECASNRPGLLVSEPRKNPDTKSTVASHKQLQPRQCIQSAKTVLCSARQMAVVAIGITGCRVPCRPSIQNPIIVLRRGLPHSVTCCRYEVSSMKGCIHRGVSVPGAQATNQRSLCGIRRLGPQPADERVATSPTTNIRASSRSSTSAALGIPSFAESVA